MEHLVVLGVPAVCPPDYPRHRSGCGTSRGRSSYRPRSSPAARRARPPGASTVSRMLSGCGRRGRCTRRSGTCQTDKECSKRALWRHVLTVLRLTDMHKGSPRCPCSLRKLDCFLGIWVGGRRRRSPGGYFFIQNRVSTFLSEAFIQSREA